MNRRIARFVLGILVFTTGVLASEIDGIWVGQQAGRRGGAAEDLAFRFKMDGQALTGKMFGDEFDLPISEGTFAGDQIHFIVTTTNYYSGSKTRFIYTGTIKGREMELTRERVPMPDDKAANRNIGKQTLKLRRVD